MGGVRNRQFGLAAEIVCFLLASEVGLKVPTPFIVNPSPQFLAGVPKHACDLVERSLGLNFASEAAPAGFSVVPAEPRVPFALRSVAAEIFAFDVLIQNYDRKADNPNLLWDRTNILMIDHEGALKALLSNPRPSFSSLQLDKFYDHVFYAAVSPDDTDYRRLGAAIGHLSARRLDELLGEVPVQWQVKEGLAKVREHILWAVENCDHVRNLIRDRLS